MILYSTRFDTSERDRTDSDADRDVTISPPKKAKKDKKDRRDKKESKDKKKKKVSCSYLSAYPP